MQILQNLPVFVILDYFSCLLKGRSCQRPLHEAEQAAENP